mmetsp:Transcript_32511/g.45383  ORF Transcript_32511/g.45383 Transcript_32511/m.45383 type:complete len:178 (-) Transcript_32511:301-834(-)
MTSKTNKGGGRKSSASDIIAISSINEVPKWKNIRGSYTGKEEEENEEEDTPWTNFRQLRNQREEKGYSTITPSRSNRIIKRRRILPKSANQPDVRVNVVIKRLRVRQSIREQGVPSKSPHLTSRHQPLPLNSDDAGSDACGKEKELHNTKSSSDNEINLLALDDGSFPTVSSLPLAM